MAAFFEVAQRLREAEEPLGELYRELRSAGANEVEQELAAHLVELQRTQLAYLEMMSGQLPREFICLGTVASEAVKLRDGPGGSHKLVAELAAGTPVIIMGWSGYWAQVQLAGGKRGYIFRDYVRTEGTAREVPAWQRPG